MRAISLAVLSFFLYAGLASNASAGAGTEAAAFLEIPVGGGPAALGGAYTALAADAYAPVWNAAGLGFVDSVQLAGQHLSYLESIHYEYLSLVYPLAGQRLCPEGLSCGASAVGFAAQYLGSGDMEGRNRDGVSTGDFSSHFAAYSVSYGKAFSSRLSLGVTAKLIDAAISDVGARAWAGDAGVLFRLSRRLTLGGTVSNIGSRLTFLQEGGALPLAFRGGLSYRPFESLTISAEGVARRTGLASGHGGLAWRPLRMISLRAGYRTDTLKELGALAGLSAGIGLDVWGHELSYAWLPYGDLGQTQYFSLVMRFGGEIGRERRDLIHFRRVKPHRTAETKSGGGDPDYQMLMQLLAEDGRAYAVRSGAEGGRP